PVREIQPVTMPPWRLQQSPAGEQRPRPVRSHQFLPACCYGSSGMAGGWFDVVVDPGRGEQPVWPAFVDAEPRLRRELMAAPADAVVLHGAAHPVVGHHAVFQLDAAARAEAPGEKRAELGGPAV